MLESLGLHLRYGASGIPTAESQKLFQRLNIEPIQLDQNASSHTRMETALLSYAQRTLRLSGKVELSPPPTIPTSSAKIYMIRNANKDVAVFKVFVDDWEAMTRELAAIQILQDADLRNIRPVQPIAAGTIQLNGKSQPALLMAAAKGEDLERIISKFGRAIPRVPLNNLRDVVRAVGEAIGEMHYKFRGSTPETSKAQEIKDYEVKRLSELTREGGVLEKLTALGWMKPEELPHTREAIGRIISEYKSNQAPLFTVTHGDGHQGNFFYDPQTGRVQAIDVQTLIWSVDAATVHPHKGYVDATVDLGRFVGALEVNGLNSGLKDSDIISLKESFLAAYAEIVGITRDQIGQSLNFFRLRLITNVLEDFNGKKMPEETRRLVLDHLLKEFGLRQDDKSGYARLDRGDNAAYAIYFAGMDNTARQKTALTTAHFPTEGKIADMGSGSGQGSADLAALYPHLEVIGVDRNPKTVEYARNTHRRDNLTFVEGDIGATIFPPDSMDGFLNSSSFHEVASFTGYNVQTVRDALRNQVVALKENRPLVVRDFLAPENSHKMVFLDLPSTDGLATGDVTQLSSAALFEDFAAKFKSSVHRSGGVPYRKLESPHPGFIRFVLDHRTATEFVLRKNYRKTVENWYRELEEEYLYWSQSEFQKEFEDAGMRVLVSKPIYNPWIVENRFKNKFYWYNAEGDPLPYPPTNYIIVGEKVSANKGASLVEASHTVTNSPSFLRLEHYRNQATNTVYDLASRPDNSIDVVAWFERNGNIYVMNRHRYPRPILNAKGVGPILNSIGTFGYVSEPLTAGIRGHKPVKQDVLDLVKEQAQISRDEIISIGKARSYYPSPGGINELVHGHLVEVKPQEHARALPRERSGFSESGLAQPANAQQVLRAYQVGGMYDSRMEINIYALLVGKRKSVGPWIAAEIDLTDQSRPFKTKRASEVLNPSPKRAFVKTSDSANFLEVRQGKFQELTREGTHLADKTLEYVVPKGFGRNTLSTIPVRKSRGKVYVGLEIRVLPAPQIKEGSSLIVTNPAWRIPKGILHTQTAEGFVKEELEKHFKVKAGKFIPLGGEYYVSPGVTPEVTFPFAVEVVSTSRDSTLHWVSLEDLVQHRDKIKDGHLLTATYRLAHAVGLLK